MPAFLINSDPDTPVPQEVIVTPRSLVGHFLDGRAVYQGYESLEAKWTTIREERLNKLLSLYDPNNQAVTVTYFDPTTLAPVTRTAIMEQPVDGGRKLGFHAFQTVSVKFTHLGPITS